MLYLTTSAHKNLKGGGYWSLCRKKNVNCEVGISEVNSDFQRGVFDQSGYRNLKFFEFGVWVFSKFAFRATGSLLSLEQGSNFLELPRCM
jgi:hypothetical protein